MCVYFTKIHAFAAFINKNINLFSHVSIVSFELFFLYKIMFNGTNFKLTKPNRDDKRQKVKWEENDRNDCK